MPSESTPAAYQAALAFLFDRIDYERALHVPYSEGAFRLERMRRLLALLGDPQAGLPIVHVAGTKGKGSTSAMIAAALSAAGYRTGLYTSPHLEQLEERFAVDGDLCTAGELVALVDALRPAVTIMERQGAHADASPTYFELTTAAALLHFRRRQVDAAVLEVGMGGRLDSTNVCQPRVAVITSISFDHTKQLGNTLAAIAREKAGIVKPGVPLVSGVTAEEPRREIEAACALRGAELIQLGREFDFVYAPPAALDQGPVRGSIDYSSHRAGAPSRTGVELGLVGRHQGANAAVCLAVLDELARQRWSLPDAAVRRGLAAARWPARVEVVDRHPTIVLDAAHNVASVAALIETLRESIAARRRILVFATTQDKDAAGMLGLLLPYFDGVILTRYQNNPRGVCPTELAALAAQFAEAPVQVCPTPAAAWHAVRADIQEDDLVCVTGSFFIAAEMRTQWSAKPLKKGSGFRVQASAEIPAGRPSLAC
ncbi:MAG TPA: folylpolyglutamate synthase/dihydrofolate synthase family protein [Pirellulales bacterium]|nr:folylpolyglutamate synthase/dihydrofolate synthase family protein [Pirellulales bacterium]